MTAKTAGMANDEVKPKTVDTGEQAMAMTSTRSFENMKKSDFRKGSRMIEETKIDATQTGKHGRKVKADTVGKAMKMGMIFDRTGADAVIYEGTNPFAVAQLGEEIILNFRRKSMGLIIAQSIFVNAIALAIDRLAPLPEWHWGLYLSTWVLPLFSLFVLNIVRYKAGCNVVMLVIFSVLIGASFGMLKVPMKVYTETFSAEREQNWSPQCYGMAGHTVALIILSLFTCFKHPLRPAERTVVKMAPASIFVAVITDAIGIVAYMAYWNYIGPPIFAVIAIVMNTLSLMWIGYQMDDLSNRLRIEEWLYPLILLWCEVFVSLFMVGVFVISIAVICSGSGDGVDVGGGCPGICDGCYYSYCDCYYGTGTSSTTARKEDDQQTKQPPQEEMSTEDHMDV